MSIFFITSALAKELGYPEPIWWAKACRQIGIEAGVEQVRDEKTKKIDIKVILPSVPTNVYESIKERAILLEKRDSEGLPTEEKPSGGFPDSDDEIADPIAFKVGTSEGRVVLDFGRPVRAVQIHPITANYVATLLANAAFEVNPNMEPLEQQAESRIAYIKAEEGETLQEALIRFPDPFVEENTESLSNIQDD